MPDQNSPAPQSATTRSGRPLRNLSWEADVVLHERRSRVIAWRVAISAAVLAAILGIGLVALLPLKKVVPYVVTIDKVTGENSVIETGKDYVETSALSDKHWIQAFILARERYMYRFVQFDYDTIQLLASDKVWATYKPSFEGPESLDKRLKDDVEIIPAILSITLHGNGTATVRYELKTRDYRQTAAPTVNRRVATIRYEFQAKNYTTEKEAIANPLGFTVTAYQTDPEMGGQ